MYGRWFPFVDAKSSDDESSLIDSPEEITSARDDYPIGQVSQNGNSATDRHPSRRSSGSQRGERHHNRIRIWNRYSWAFLLQNFLFVYATCRPHDSDACTVGLHTAGRTWPKGDIFLEYGQSLKIYCILNEISTDPRLLGRNASDLRFFRNDVAVEQKYITVINETAIVMHMERPSPSVDMYYCKLKVNSAHSDRYEAVCLNRVGIGFKPEQPRNFSCVSYNLEKLVCSWDPVPNYIATRFSVRIRLPGRAGRRFGFPCPEPQREYDLLPNTCLWDSSTDPMYRPAYESYTFTLTAENALGINSFDYKFHHWAHVIPSKPVNLLVVSKTSSSAFLHWSVPFPMQTFPPGIDHRVSYRNQMDSSGIWKTIDITDRRHSSKIYFNLTDLQQANAVYSVRVFLKSPSAVGEDKWSQFSEVTVKTAPTLPGLPPKTDIGSFDIAINSGNRDVYVYWQAIPQDLENGDNFTYQVVSVEENGHRLDLQPHEITDAYAMFKCISFSDFKFEIAAANCEGTSSHKATVHVPNQLEMPQKPIVFTKIAFDGGIYELSWNSSSNSDTVDYTVFWCENDRDRPYQCSGYLDWIRVPRDIRGYNITVPNLKAIYQFAIAANTADASSGMAWASSTTVLSDVVGKMKSVWVTRTESELIEVRWELEYSGRIGVIEKFIINYCPIVSAHNLTCDGPKMITTVPADPYVLHGIVRGLRPHTTYLITVAVSTVKGQGLQSDALYITTLKNAENPVSQNHTTPIDAPPDPASQSAPYDINVSPEIAPRSTIVGDFDRERKKSCGGNGDCESNEMNQLDSESTSCINEVNRLTLALSACKERLDFLSETVLSCNEIS